MGGCCSTKEGHGSEINVSMFGLNGSGQSTIFKLLRHGSDSRTPIAPSSTSTNYNGYQVDGIDIDSLSSFTLWDVGGARHRRKDWHYYYPQRDGFIYVVDASNRERVNESREVLHYTLMTELDHANMSTQPLLVLATKSELPNALSPEDLIGGLDLESIVNRQWRVYPIQQDQIEPLHAGVEWLLEEIESEKQRQQLEASESDAANKPGEHKRKLLVENSTDSSPVSSGSGGSGNTIMSIASAVAAGGTGVPTRSHRARTMDADDNDDNAFVGGAGGVELGALQSSRSPPPRINQNNTTTLPSYSHHHVGGGDVVTTRSSASMDPDQRSREAAVNAAAADMARTLVSSSTSTSASRTPPASVQSTPVTAATATQSFPAAASPSLTITTASTQRRPSASPTTIPPPVEESTNVNTNNMSMSNTNNDNREVSSLPMTPLSPPLILSPHGGRFGLPVTDDHDAPDGHHDDDTPTHAHHINDGAAEDMDDVPLGLP